MIPLLSESPVAQPVWPLAPDGADAPPESDEAGSFADLLAAFDAQEQAALPDVVPDPAIGVLTGVEPQPGLSQALLSAGQAAFTFATAVPQTAKPTAWPPETTATDQPEIAALPARIAPAMQPSDVAAKASVAATMPQPAPPQAAEAPFPLRPASVPPTPTFSAPTAIALPPGPEDAASPAVGPAPSVTLPVAAPPTDAPAAPMIVTPASVPGVRSAELALLLRAGQGVPATSTDPDLTAAVQAQPNPPAPPVLTFVGPALAHASPKTQTEAPQTEPPQTEQEPDLAFLPPAAVPVMPTLAPPPPSSADWVTRLIQTAATGQDAAVDMVMNPEELGRLRFELTRVGDQLQVHLTVERPETLDLMRRHSEQLLADLRAAGFADASLSFGTWGGDRAPANSRRDASAAPDTPAPPPSPLAASGSQTGAGLDLRL